MRPAGLLGRGMKFDVANVDAWAQRHSERLNAAVEVLIIERVLIMPDSGRWVAHFVTHEPDTVHAVIRVELGYRCTSPGCNRWLLTHRAAHGTETKGLIDSAYGVLLV